MRKWLLALFLLAAPAAAQNPNNETVPPQCTVAQLAAGTCAPAKLGTRVRVSNNAVATADSDCASGTGVSVVLCEYTGTAWVSIDLLYGLGGGGISDADYGDVVVSGVGTIWTVDDNSVDGTDIALGSDAAGDVMYYDGTNWVRLAKGTAGQVLEMNAGATAPEWDADSGGSVCVNLPASRITCLGTAGCTGGSIDGTNTSVVTADFATDADDRGDFHFVVPTGWTGIELTVTIYWISNHADCDNSGVGTDTVNWLIDSGGIANDEPFLNPTLAGTAANATDTCILNGDLETVQILNYVHGAEDGEAGILALTRDVDADAYLQDAKLVSVSLCPE